LANAVRLLGKTLSIVRALLTRRIPFDIDGVPVPVENLPLRKVVNWVLTETSVRVKPAKPWGMPTVLQLEPTSHCNLSCPVCPVTTGLNRQSGSMDYDLYRKIIDELKDHVLVLMFWDWGEPLLHPRGAEMIRYARDAGIRVVCFTNGHLLAKPEKARQIVESGLDQIVFAVDGITEETYREFRVGGTLENVKLGIRNVVDAKRELGLETPVVNFRFIVMRHNEHEVPKLQDFAGPLGVDVLTLRRFHSVPKQGPFWVDAASELVPIQKQFQLPPRGDDGMPVRASHNPCRTLWNNPTIHWDGTVASCSMDFGEERPLGKLPGKSFREIWGSDSYREIRRSFRNGWQKLPLCSECASGYVGGDFGRDATAGAVFFNRNGQNSTNGRSR
jgi:MoaA/NifB/PqqE/SkfB family radical SAM enzyme